MPSHPVYCKEWWVVLAWMSWLFVRGLSNKKLPKGLFLNFDSYILTSCWREISSACHYTQVPAIRCTRDGLVEDILSRPLAMIRWISLWMRYAVSLRMTEIWVRYRMWSISCRMWYWQIRISGGEESCHKKFSGIIMLISFSWSILTEFPFQQKSRAHTPHSALDLDPVLRRHLGCWWVVGRSCRPSHIPVLKVLHIRYHPWKRGIFWEWKIGILFAWNWRGEAVVI